jgi:hypothetical protein
MLSEPIPPGALKAALEAGMTRNAETPAEDGSGDAPPAAEVAEANR